MYFLNARNVPEFAMYATRKEAEIAKIPLAGGPAISQRFLTKPELLEKFPFIRHVDCAKTTDWEHPVFSDTGTFLDCIPNGWQKPWFMETMLMSLAAAIQADGMDMGKIYMTDAKEKYGSLRMDFDTGHRGPCVRGHVPRLGGTCRLFMLRVRQAACFHYRGWICPYCKDCWDDINGPFTEVPLENPKISTWENGERVERVIDLKPLFDKVVSVWEDTNVK